MFVFLTSFDKRRDLLLFSDVFHEMSGKDDIKIIIFSCPDVWISALGIAVCPDVLSSDVILCVEKTLISCSGTKCLGNHEFILRWKGLARKVMSFSYIKKVLEISHGL